LAAVCSYGLRVHLQTAKTINHSVKLEVTVGDCDEALKRFGTDLGLLQEEKPNASGGNSP
jgi:hypothetical protein